MSSVDVSVAASPARSRRAEALPVLVGATVALLPILLPAGPGNTAISDVGMAAGLLVAALWVSREQLPLAFPYAAGGALLIIGGALAATVSGAPASTALVLAQDVFLLLWAAALALGRHDAAVVAAATTTWCRVAVGYSVIFVVSYIVGFSPLSGVTADNGVRASYTFGDPNLAGNYFVMSLFLMAACKRPRADSTRRVGYLIVLVAMGFTGSNGAMLTLLVGLVLSVAVSQYRRRGPMAAFLSLSIAGVLAAMVLTFVLPYVPVNEIRAQAASGVPLLRDSFGRSENSTGERVTILDEGTDLFFEGNAIGVGPGRTKATFQETQAPYVKEAHNDYLATLLERGILGAVGLALLIAAVAGRCRGLLSGDPSPSLAAVVPRAYLLVVIAPVVGVAASFYEVLHFRHVWTWLGVLAAIAAVTRPREERRP